MRWDSFGIFFVCAWDQTTGPTEKQLSQHSSGLHGITGISGISSFFFPLLAEWKLMLR